MANVILPKFNVKKLNQNPDYKAYINELNKNPVQAYKEYTVLEETSNPLSMADGGLELIKDVKSKLNVNQNELDQAFQPVELPPELKTKIGQNPEDAYKMAYNAYHYGDYGTDSKLQLRSVMSSLKNDLISKGKNPDEIINSNPVMKSLNFVGKLINVPPALLAKGYASLYGKSDQVKIWGGNGWEDALRAVDMNPEMQSLIQKKAKNIPLVASEEAKVKEFDKRNAGWGLLWNIVADPTILAGIFGKGLSFVSKGLKTIEGMESIGKAVGTAGKIGEAISAPIQTFKDTKRVAEFEKSGELLNQIRNNLTVFKNKAGNLLNDQEVAKIDDLLKSEKVNPDDYFKTTNMIADKASVEGKTDLASMINQTNQKLTSTLTEMKDTLGSKAYQGIEGVLNKPIKINGKEIKINKLLEGASEKIGIRKALVSDVPLEAQTIDGLIKNPKEFIDKARRMGQGATQTALKAVYKISKLIDKELIPELLSNKNVIKEFNLEAGKKYSYNDLKGIVSQVIERPKMANKLGVNSKTINSIHDALDDYIIEETKVVGSKAMPLLTSKNKKAWEELSNSYKELSRTNAYHPDIPKIKTEMKKILQERGSKDVSQTGELLDIDNSLAYLTRVMTPEAKKISNSMESPVRNQFNAKFRSFITNPSYKGRKLLNDNSIYEINNQIKSGELVNKLDGLIKASDNGEDIEGIKQLTDLRNYFDKFKGIDFFNTDVKQTIGIRGARMSRTIMQGEFFNGIKQFGFDVKNIDGIQLVKPKVRDIVGLSDKYFHPDIAAAIDKVYDFVENPNKLMNILKSFQGFWKVLQLSYPSTVLRNMIGNILNSFLVIKNPLKYIESWKDAFFGIAGKNYDVITSTGKVIPLNEIIQQGIQRGLTGSTLKKIDIDQVQNETQSIGAGVLNNTAKGIDHIASMFQRFPATGWTAKGNDIIEGTSKLALFIQSIKEGMSFDNAAENTFKALFDYSDTTKLTNKIRNFIPFFIWTRKNLPLQIGNLLSIPSKTIIKSEESINANRPSNQEVDKRYQSEYLKQSPNVQVGEQNGKPQFILLEGLLPLFDLSRLSRVFTGNTQIIFDDLVKDITPMIKTPIELSANRSYATHRDLTKSQYGTTEYLGMNISPKLKAVLDDWRIFGTANKGINIAKMVSKDAMSVMPDKNIAKMIFSWALASPIDYDVNYSRIIESSNFKSVLDNEINDYYGYMQKVKKAMLNGEQFPKKIVFNRLGLIVNLIVKGYQDGKLSDKDLSNLGNKIYGVFK